MAGDSPLTVNVHTRKGLRPGSETVFADLTLTNRAKAARWFVLRAQLHEPLQESFCAQLVQVCGFDSNPDVRYLQALGVETGLLAFHLAPGATLELVSAGLRLDGGVGAFELIEAKGLVDDSGRRLETLFEPGEAADTAPSGPTQIEGQARVIAAYQRRTLRTAEPRGLQVELEVVKRWEGLALTPEGSA